MKIHRSLKIIVVILVLITVIYGLGRLYFAITAGFTIGNITTDLPYDPRWKTHELSKEEQDEIDQALHQEYDYLGKGCQSYVFASRDGKYVIKFFKFQRFRPQAWIDLFTFIPSVKQYQQNKTIEKKHNLEKLFRSCVIAFDIFPKQTGLVYVHLNPSDDKRSPLIIQDKLGLTHQIDLDNIDFILQRRAILLADAINNFMEKHQKDQAEMLIDKLLVMLLSEYLQGYADNDHALMQNTGVLDGSPIHIDVGQFIYNPIVRNPTVFKQEMYNKTTQLRKWLEKNQPTLVNYLNNRLLALLGFDYFTMTPYVHKGNVGKIPHQEEAWKNYE